MGLGCDKYHSNQIILNNYFGILFKGYIKENII